MFDEITINRIKLLHPNYREQIKKWYLEINKQLPKGVRLRFTHTYRSKEEQDKLYAQGRTTKGSKVTNAKGGQSIHNYGLAFDIVILLDKDNNGTFETASFTVDKYWKQVAEFFKSKGFSWGGDWTFKDYPHFEVKGFKWQDLQNKPTIKDGGITYPKL